MTESLDIVRVILSGTEIYPLFRSHHISLSFQRLHAPGHIYIHPGRLFLFRHFRSDQNDAVCASRTIDSCRGCILEGLYRGNVSRIQIRNIIDRHTVHDIQWFRFRIYGGDATDADGYA